MFLQRIALAFVLVIILGKHLPPIVHDFTPFIAEGHEEKGYSCKFAHSRMIDFFEYQITYDLKIPLDMAWYPRDKDAFFGIADEINYKYQFDLNWRDKVNSDSVLITVLNTTIRTISVAPIHVKGGFVYRSEREAFKADEHVNIVAEIPGAEPFFNPLLLSLLVVYSSTVFIGFFIETMGSKSLFKKKEKYALSDEKSETSVWKQIKDHTAILVYWMVVVAIEMAVVVSTAIKFGAIPPIY